MNCLRCGHANPPEDKFCGNCGAPLSVSASPPEDAPSVLEAQLAVLTQQNIVYEHTRLPELAYIFRHALLQEASYASLLHTQRRAVHQRVALALEELSPLRPAELAPLLAHHFYAAEDWPRAAQHAQAAGTAAAQHYALREAAAHFQLAIEALERMGGGRPQVVAAAGTGSDAALVARDAGAAEPDVAYLSQQLDALLGWAQAGFSFAPYDLLVARLTRAEQLARALHDTPRLLDALHWIGAVHLQANLNYRAIPAMIEWFQLATDHRDEKLSVVPMYWWGFLMVDRDPRGAIAQMDQVIAAARKHGDAGVEAHALATQGMAHARLGEFTAARANIAAALELVQGIDVPIKEADVNNLAGFAYLDMGDVPRALEYAELGSRRALTINAPDCAGAGLMCVGLAKMRQQRLAEARSAFDQVIGLAEVSGAGPFKNMGQAALAMLDLMGGKGEALADLERALANARLSDDQYGVAMFSQIMGEALLEMGDTARAEECLNDALAYYRRAEMKPYIARVLQSLARLYTRQGRGPDATAVLAELDTAGRQR